MWFRVSFFQDKPPLSVIVAPDEKVYFKAVDVGRFLGYKSFAGFANRYALKDVKEMIPNAQLLPLKKVLVFSYDQFINIIEKTRRRHCLSDEIISDIMSLWTSGRVPFTFPKYPVTRPKFAPHLLVKKDEGDCSVREWIKIYTMMTLKFYSCVQRAQETGLPLLLSQLTCHTAIDEYRTDYLNKPPQSVPSNFLSESSNFLSEPKLEPMNQLENLQSPSDSKLEPMNQSENLPSQRELKLEPMNQSVNMQSPRIPESNLQFEFQLSMECDGFIEPPRRVCINVRGTEHVYTRI